MQPRARGAPCHRDGSFDSTAVTSRGWCRPYGLAHRARVSGSSGAPGDGRRCSSVGGPVPLLADVTWERAGVFDDAGADDGVDLDGGGSSALVTRDRVSGTPVVRNHPVGGAERPIPEGIGLFSRGWPTRQGRHGNAAALVGHWSHVAALASRFKVSRRFLQGPARTVVIAVPFGAGPLVSHGVRFKGHGRIGNRRARTPVTADSVHRPGAITVKEKESEDVSEAGSAGEQPARALRAEGERGGRGTGV
ncbi:phosphodiester glycosidase family protein [Streptomyces sp. GMY02]|nr:phosphodiester glycosidase family protein [Streptomyces sp. GMY02]